MAYQTAAFKSASAGGLASGLESAPIGLKGRDSRERHGHQRDHHAQRKQHQAHFRNSGVAPNQQQRTPRRLRGCVAGCSTASCDKDRC